jgi:hypothetical protein
MLHTSTIFTILKMLHLEMKPLQQPPFNLTIQIKKKFHLERKIKSVRSIPTAGKSLSLAFAIKKV